MPLDNKPNNRRYIISIQNRDLMMWEHIFQTISALSHTVGNKLARQKAKYII